jgi:hypothetical protein
LAVTGKKAANIVYIFQLVLFACFDSNLFRWDTHDFDEMFPHLLGMNEASSLLLLSCAFDLDQANRRKKRP